MAEGLAAGMTGRQAAEYAISSFGSVRAVVRAHQQRRRPAALTLLASLAAAAWQLAARRWAPRALPDGFVPAVAVTLFGAAGAALAWLSVAGPIRVSPGGASGPGAYLSGAIAALAVAAGFALPLRRVLLRHARG